MGLIKLETAKGDFFFEEDYKVVLRFDDVWKNGVWNTGGMRQWCVDHLQGEVITDRGPTNSDEYMTWYFEYKTDAMLFALKWS